MAVYELDIASCNNQIEEVPELDNCADLSVMSLLGKVRKLLASHPPLLARIMQPLGDDSSKENETARSPVRIMQWNCLAQALSTGKDNFVRCPKAALAWDTRKFRMVEEILTVDPDILCMQEVDHFGYFAPVLASVGFKGSFFPKPDSPALYSEDSNGPDGCAMFYKADKLAVVESDSVVLRNSKGSLTNQVSVIYTFKQKLESDTGSADPLYGPEFTVATTHLKAKLGWDELRHQQGSYLLKYLTGKYGQTPLVICGDLNADPSEKVYGAFRDSELGLKSAYTHLSACGTREPLYTTWKIRGGRGEAPDNDVCRTLDYIWCTRDKFQVLSLLDLSSDSAIGADRLPNFHYPSDHLSIAADLLLQ